MAARRKVVAKPATAEVKSERKARVWPQVKDIVYRSADAKYVGIEPAWPDAEKQRKWTASDRKMQIVSALNWYTYTQETRDSRAALLEFLSHVPRYANAIKQIKTLSDDAIAPAIGWLCRMARRGLVLKFSEVRRIVKEVKVAAARAVPVVETAPVNKPINIQERLDEKMEEFLGEVEGAFDDYLTGKTNTAGVMHVAQAMNPPSQRISNIAAVLERRVAEWNTLYTSKDKELREGLGELGQREIKARLAWWQQALADVNSYANIKKTARKPRKRKAVKPEKVVAKLKYCRKNDELKLTSIQPVDILRCSELWVYDVKKRKLGVYITDPHVSTLGVKNSKIIGFDPVTSVQKTLRKPEDQIKKLMAAGKPASRKFLKDVKSVETKLSGRINENCVLLKAYK